jgi:hypothetical protein
MHENWLHSIWRYTSWYLDVTMFTFSYNYYATYNPYIYLFIIITHPIAKIRFRVISYISFISSIPCIVYPQVHLRILIYNITTLQFIKCTNIKSYEFFILVNWMNKWYSFSYLNNSTTWSFSNSFDYHIQPVVLNI